MEGGGSSKEQKAELRLGFDGLFAEAKSAARGKRLSLNFICCGSRREAYEAFLYAHYANPDRINALLVDSESAVASVPRERTSDAALRRDHLQQRQSADGRGQGDGWNLAHVDPERIHLMVQCMETWIVADPEALEGFYKQGFRGNRLPQRLNLEEESKNDVIAKLEGATEDSGKGKYAKIRHASKLLVLLNPEKIAKRCARFSIFRDWLNDSIEGAA